MSAVPGVACWRMGRDPESTEAKRRRGCFANKEGYVTTKKRMTILESAKVTRWMLDNTDDVSEMTPEYLAQRVYQECGVEITESTAARHRKLVGIVPVKQPRTRKERVKQTGWKDRTDARIARIEAQLGIMDLSPESQE